VVKRARGPAPNDQEVAIGKRIRLVRTEKTLGQRATALQMGLSRDQLNRIETGTVAPRFFAAWNFCQFTDTNPLWLAFGDAEGRFGFVACANSNVSYEARFLEVLQTYGERYRTLRWLTHSSWFEIGSVFSDSESLLSADFIELKRRVQQDHKKGVGKPSIKHYLIAEMAPESLTWEKLRSLLGARTVSQEAKLALSKHLGVSLAAVSQFRTGASAPTADNALKILSWLRSVETNTKPKKHEKKSRTK
jgi:transcriptional regulator with XRE-family HTH domain